MDSPFTVFYYVESHMFIILVTHLLAFVILYCRL